ncbi:MAG: hypothetical protein HW421_2989 [Ignavibacteria bacterium]|nr:hypothetical protein [Ignavibacteria bacterium]
MKLCNSFCSSKILKKRIITITAFAIILIQGCGSYGNIFKQIIGMDPEPPPGYKPVFITKIKEIPSELSDSVKLTVSRTDPYKENRVKLYLHLIEGDTAFLTGGADGKWKKIWCKVTDSSNGEEREITEFKIREASKSDRKPQAIAMVMDHSGSMGNSRAHEVQKAVEHFLNDSKKDNDKIALIKYDDSIGVECPLTNNIETLNSKFELNGLGKFGRQTATIDAIAAGIREVSKAEAGLERVVMVFTDGQDNKSGLKKNDIINLAHANNVIICAIDYGISISEGFLESIAKATNGTYNHIYKAKEFNLVYSDIYTRLEHYYELEYEPQDYGHHTVTIKLCDKSGKEIIATGSYDNVPYEGLATILNVYFNTNSDNLKSESNKAIQNVYALMKKNPKMKIELRGHTDSKGSKDKNLTLSQDRADAVRNALIEKGIDASRIKAVGFGDTMPVADNQTEEGRAKNRRTEFIVLQQ